MKQLLSKGVVVGIFKGSGSLLGIAFTLGLAWTFGASATTDALFAALLLPVILWQNLPTIIGQVSIPFLCSDADKITKNGLLRSLVSMAWLAGTITLLLCLFFSHSIIEGIAGGLDASTTKAAARYLQILAPIFPITLFCGILQTDLYSQRKFYAVECSLLLWKIVPVIMLGIFYYTKMLTGETVAWSFSIAGILRLILLLFFTQKSLSSLLLSPLAGRKTTIPKTVSSLFATEMVIVSADWILETLTRFLGSLLPFGGLSLYNYADKITRTLPIQVIRGFGTVLLPDMASDTKKGRNTLLVRVLFIFAVSGALLSIALYLCAPLLSRLIFLPSDISLLRREQLADTIMAFSPAILAMMIIMVCQLRLFLEENKNVFITGNLLQASTLLVLWGTRGISTAADLALYLTASMYVKMTFFLLVTFATLRTTKTSA